MNEFYEEAIRKLEAGLKESCGKYGDAMKADVCAALKEFCQQDAEFAQAVAQGGSFKDCMAEVAKGVKGNSISDMKAFGLAVEFFFPGAGIEVKMTIDLCASVSGKDETKKNDGLIIDLSSFF